MTTGNASESRPVRTTTGLPKNVWALAWTAFFNDSSTEMSYWLLPQFLTTVLGAPPIAFGLIEGAAETAASFSRLLSGWLSDFLHRRQPLAAAGYSLANIVKPLLAVTKTWQHVFAIRFVDRASKGFRAAPRDALMADSVDAGNRGAAFGFRQAMDTAGAIVGPLSAIALLRVFAGNIRNVFWIAAVPGLATILLAWFAVEEVPGPPKPSRPSTHSIPAALGVARARLMLMLTAIGLFSLGNSSDLFLVLRAQNLGMKAWAAPALGLVFNVVYAALSWPAGKLSDRVPRRWLVVGGYLIYAVVYAGFSVLRTPNLVWVLFALYGTYYALTEGVMKAWVADLAPSESRASTYGLLNWVVGVAAFPASLLTGWLWQRYSPATPFAVSSLLALAAGLLLLIA